MKLNSSSAFGFLSSGQSQSVEGRIFDEAAVFYYALITRPALVLVS